MGHYATYVVHYEGENPEPVLDALREAIDWYPEDFSTVGSGCSLTYIDAPQDVNEIIEALTPLSKQFNTTFAVAYQDDYSEGMFNFYVGDQSQTHEIDEKLDDLRQLLSGINEYSTEIILEASLKAQARNGYILGAMDALETILRSPTEPVLE